MGSRCGNDQDEAKTTSHKINGTDKLENVKATKFEVHEDRDGGEASEKNVDFDESVDESDTFLGCRHRARNLAAGSLDAIVKENGTSDDSGTERKSSKCHREKLLEKRKIHDGDDDALVCSPTERKRKYQLEPENDASLSSASSEDCENPRVQVDSILGDISPKEISDLRKHLEDGEYSLNYFSWTFWESLHANHGSTFGYTFGFLIIFLLNYEWMLEEFADATEGHAVAKTFVILFVIYSYSFITMGLEFVQLVFLVLGLYFPRYFRNLLDRFNYIVGMNEKLKKFSTSNYFYTSIVVLWCALTGFIGSVLWKWFWWNHICKSYHDRTCRGSWLGQLVINYRDEACYDGTASSMICERFVSYAPIMIFSVFFVFLGNVLMPLLNDQLSLHCPLSENLEMALSLMNLLSEESVSDPNDTSRVSHEFSSIKKNLDFSTHASKSDSKVIQFGGCSPTVKP